MPVDSEPLPDNLTIVREGDDIRRDEIHYVVSRACDDNQGYWYCVTHKHPMANQLEKERHTNDKQDHQLAWWCIYDGPEVP